MVMAPLVASLGCAQVSSTALPEVPGEVRTGLGQVGLVTVAYTPEIAVTLPLGRGDAAARGAIVGTLAWLQVTSGAGPLGLVLMLGTPVVAGVGAAIGAAALNPEPVADVKEHEALLRTTLGEAEFLAEASKALLARAGERPDVLMTRLQVPGPADRADRPRYRNVAADTVVELGVTALRLVRTGSEDALKHDSNPGLTLEAIGRVRLVRVSDGAERYTHTFKIREGVATLASWAAEDAAELRHALFRAADDLGGQIYRAMFASVTRPSSEVIEQLRLARVMPFDRAATNAARLPSHPCCGDGWARGAGYRQGPVMAKVTPGVWMFANSHRPSGLHVAPAHSKPRKSPVRPFFSPASTMAFCAIGNT
jgi:hypothetical protein